MIEQKNKNRKFVPDFSGSMQKPGKPGTAFTKTTVYKKSEPESDAMQEMRGSWLWFLCN